MGNVDRNEWGDGDMNGWFGLARMDNLVRKWEVDG